MTTDERFVLRLNDHADAVVRLANDLNVVVEFRAIGGTEPVPCFEIYLETLQRVASFAEFHSTGGSR